MADLLPERRAMLLVLGLGILGFVVNLVRGVPVLLALAVGAGIVLGPVLVMSLIRWRPLGKRVRASPSPADIEIGTAAAFELLEFGTHVANRIRGWMEPELDGDAKAHAEEASAAIDDIVDVLNDICGNEELAVRSLPAMRASMQVVKSLTDQKPTQAANWFHLKDRLASQAKNLHGVLNPPPTRNR